MPVTDPDARRYFMTASEATSLVMKADLMSNAPETYWLDMGEPVRIGDFAERLLALEMEAGAAAVPVQIIDISLAGVQFVSKTEMVVGERAELKATFGSRTVNVPVEIRRVSPQANAVRGGMRYWAGAVFGPMSAEQKVLMEQLLGAEPL